MDANKIPILTFHALEAPTTPISFPPALFERAIRKWHAKGWRAIALTEAAQYLRRRKPAPPKSFVLTFDDGYASVYRFAFPVLRKLGMTATVFVAPNETGFADEAALPNLYRREMLRWGEIREMQKYGIAFGAHTLTHRNLRTLPLEVVEQELRGSQRAIAEALGTEVPCFAYPGGFYTEQVRALAEKYFTAAVTDKLGIATQDSDLLVLERVETFYMRDSWAADGFTANWFPWYLEARGLPRRLRRMFRGKWQNGK